jgi:hypothetical protein
MRECMAIRKSAVADSMPLMGANAYSDAPMVGVGCRQAITKANSGMKLLEKQPSSGEAVRRDLEKRIAFA